jgi:hypothetical protein
MNPVTESSTEVPSVIDLLLARKQERQPYRPPRHSAVPSFFRRFLKSLRKMNKAQRDAFREAGKRAAKLRAKFEVYSCQQKRRDAFQLSFLEVSEKYPHEPRRARRRMARSIGRRRWAQEEAA